MTLSVSTPTSAAASLNVCNSVTERPKLRARFAVSTAELAVALANWVRPAIIPPNDNVVIPVSFAVSPTIVVATLSNCPTRPATLEASPVIAVPTRPIWVIIF